MKYVLLFLTLLSVNAYGQQDSITYSKGIRSTGTPVWFRESTTKIGDSLIYSKVPWTETDTLVYLTLINERYDAANQYRLAKSKWEADEKSYKLRMRQPTKQLNDLFGKNQDGPKTNINGTWLLNGVQVEIVNDKMNSKRISWYSELVFEWNKEIFTLTGNKWVSEKSILKPLNSNR